VFGSPLLASRDEPDKQLSDSDWQLDDYDIVEITCGAYAGTASSNHGKLLKMAYDDVVVNEFNGGTDTTTVSTYGIRKPDQSAGDGCWFIRKTASTLPT